MIVSTKMYLYSIADRPSLVLPERYLYSIANRPRLPNRELTVPAKQQKYPPPKIFGSLRRLKSQSSGQSAKRRIKIQPNTQNIAMKSFFWKSEYGQYGILEKLRNLVSHLRNTKIRLLNPALLPDKLEVTSSTVLNPICILL